MMKRASQPRRNIFILYVCCSLTACFILVMLARWPHVVTGLIPRFVYSTSAASQDTSTFCKSKVKIPKLPKEYLERNRVMLNYCEATTNFTNSNPFAYYKRADLQHIYVNDKYGFLFCRLPKTGISNWKRVLIYLLTNGADTSVFSRTDAQIHESSVLELTRLNQYSENEILCRLNSYLKIVFVRHPLDRLLSAYRSKFQPITRENVRDFFLKYGRTIIKRYRSNPLSESLTLGHDVQFNEFLRYVRDTPSTSLDRHWAPYEDQCLLCKVNYDFIGKHETMTADADYLLDLWKVSDIRFPPPYRDLTDEACFFKSFYDNISPALVDDLSTKFKRDASMFGYAKLPPFIANNTFCKAND